MIWFKIDLHLENADATKSTTPFKQLRINNIEIPRGQVYEGYQNQFEVVASHVNIYKANSRMKNLTKIKAILPNISFQLTMQK